MLLSGVTVYAVNTWLAKPYVGGAFLNGHLNDVFAPLVLLSWSGLLAAKETSANRWLHSVTGAIVIVTAASVVWEVLTPHFVSAATGDWLDVICYAAGVLIFVSLHRLAGLRPKPTQRVVHAVHLERR